ncbi:MAG: ExbD/TolR family protein [Thalassotalea sp.]
MTTKRRSVIDKDSEVDMTPMLDIVFILLIFFIVTTSFVKELAIEISKPKASTNSSPDKPSMVINVSEDGLIRFNNQLVDIERVVSRIEHFLVDNDSNTVLLIPSKEATYDLIVAVMDKIKSHSNLTIAIGK